MLLCSLSLELWTSFILGEFSYSSMQYVLSLRQILQTKTDKKYNQLRFRKQKIEDNNPNYAKCLKGWFSNYTSIQISKIGYIYSVYQWIPERMRTWTRWRRPGTWRHWRKGLRRTRPRPSHSVFLNDGRKVNKVNILLYCMLIR